jgi:glycerate-2-kinase
MRHMGRAGSERTQPADDLAEHRSHEALDAVGALIRTGQSGTNVGDVVVGIVERSSHPLVRRT